MTSNDWVGIKNQSGCRLDTLPLVKRAELCSATCRSLSLQSIFLYSDIIDYQIVGISRATLMGLFAMKGQHGELQSWPFNTQQYIEIPVSYIKSVEIRFCTQTGELVPFLGETQIAD